MSEESRAVPELPEYAERVLDLAEAIPPGRVMTYGDVAEWLEEGGPRQVGRVMSLYGGGVPWWRVVRADGVLLPGHELRALEAYRAEGTPLREAGRTAEGHVPRLDMRRARWDGGATAPGSGAAVPERRTGDLEGRDAAPEGRIRDREGRIRHREGPMSDREGRETAPDGGGRASGPHRGGRASGSDGGVRGPDGGARCPGGQPRAPEAHL